MMDDASPLIVRVAGLPTQAIEPFTSELWDSYLRDHLKLQEDLSQARSEMVNKLHDVIHESSKEQRRALLTIKRDCFNGRRIKALRDKPVWPNLREVASALVDRIVYLEEEIDDAQRSFEEAYQKQRQRERRDLIQLLDQPGLMRGMTLGSLALTENLSRLTSTPTDAYGRREKRLESSLLRYATRAALKLTPFSTLTRIGLGMVREDHGNAGFQLLSAGSWHERSLVCLRRYLMDQISDILSGYPPFRQTLTVLLNDSIERSDEDRYRFLKPGCWELNAESGGLQHVKPAVVKVRLAGPIPLWLGQQLAGQRWSYGELLAQLHTNFHDRDAPALQNFLDNLLKIGFLSFLMPWSSDDLHLEKLVLEHLESLPSDEALEPFLKHFRRTLGLLDEFSTTSSPTRSVVEGKRHVEGMLTAIAPLGGLDQPLQFKPQDHYFLEDVFLLPRNGDTSHSEVVRVSKAQAERALHDLEPLARLSNLDSSRHDFLHSLTAFAINRWPDQRQLEFMDFFNAAQPLFQEYVRFEIKARGEPALLAPVFNPMQLESIERLGEWRRMVSRGLDRCIEAVAGDQLLCRESLTELLDRVPGPYAATRDFCAFLQPLNDHGSLWVLNRIFEGAGRLSSRYTTIMDEETRRHWTSYFTQRSVFEQQGELVELIDLFCPAGHIINVHAVQTRRVLEVPGVSSSLPEERRLRLRDLRVRLLGAESAPQLTDQTGRRLLPLHLGGLVFRFMPNLFKFLTMFGPGEFRYCLPRRNAQQLKDTTIFNRHRIGNVVFVRKTWIFNPEKLRASLEGVSEVESFSRINEWRAAREIPARVFLVEPLARDSIAARKKPQYIDFTSPMLVEIFRSVILMGFQELSLTEALPAPEQMPKGDDGRRWAVEVQLDNFAFPSTATTQVSPHPPVC